MFTRESCCRYHYLVIIRYYQPSVLFISLMKMFQQVVREETINIIITYYLRFICTKLQHKILLLKLKHVDTHTKQKVFIRGVSCKSNKKTQEPFFFFLNITANIPLIYRWHTTQPLSITSYRLKFSSESKVQTSFEKRQSILPTGISSKKCIGCLNMLYRRSLWICAAAFSEASVRLTSDEQIDIATIVRYVQESVELVIRNKITSIQI